MRGLRLAGLAATVAVALAVPGTAAAAPGDLDTDFSGDGKVLTKVGPDSQARAVAAGDHGTIYVAGIAQVGARDDFLLMRYKRNGSLDRDFSGNGIATLDIKGGNDSAFAIAVQPDGKIVVGGSAATAAAPNTAAFALARFKPNGRVDRNFSRDGRVRTDLGGSGSTIYDLALLKDGRILAVGAYSAVPGQLALARYKPNGKLDPTFGEGQGIEIDQVPGGTDDKALGVALKGQKFYVGGYSNQGGSTGYDFVAARYDSAGDPDDSFSLDGFATASLSDNTGVDLAFDLELDESGRPVLGGEADNAGSTSGGFGLARFETDGDLDATFNPGGSPAGTERESFTTADVVYEFANRIAIDDAGRIVAVGPSSPDDIATDFGVLRFGANGGLNASFSPDSPAGVAFTDFNDGVDLNFDVLIQGTGKIVVVGRRFAGGIAKVAIARYLG